MRVLFVCTANVCRSRMAAEVFRVLTWSMSGREAYEARSAGTHPDPSGRPLKKGDLEWADIVCVMEEVHRGYIRARWRPMASKIRVLDIPDIYTPGDPGLQDLLATHILSLLAEGAPKGTPSGRLR